MMPTYPAPAGSEEALVWSDVVHSDLDNHVQNRWISAWRDIAFRPAAA
jgi:hypothetical protein